MSQITQPCILGQDIEREKIYISQSCCFLFSPPTKTHYFALASKPNTSKYNSNPQWDQYIQHGGTTPKRTKLMRPLYPTKLKQIPIYTIYSSKCAHFPAIPTYLHPMYNIGSHRRKQPPRRLVFVYSLTNINKHVMPILSISEPFVRESDVERRALGK